MAGARLKQKAQRAPAGLPRKFWRACVGSRAKFRHHVENHVQTLLVRCRRSGGVQSPNRHPMTTTGTISDILKSKGAQVWSVEPGATVFDAIKLLAEKNVGALLVMKGESLVGIISERDYTRKVVLKGKSSKDTLVSEILSGQIVHVTPAHSIEDCLRLMTDRHVRHLPVLEKSKVVGIVSIGDLVNWIITQQSQTIQQLQTYITGLPG
jgi:CBS domain-containing protein